MIYLFSKCIADVWYGVACKEKRVYGTSFGKSQEAVLSSLLKYIPFDAPFEAFTKPSPFANKLLAALKEAYDGKGFSEDIQLAADNLTPYNMKVLEICTKIPLGYVASYGAMAKAAGGSARSVGTVMARNPFAPLVPCHRVVKSDFALGGYGGGTQVKSEILNREKKGYKTKRDIAAGGKKMTVYPVEIVLKKLKEEKEKK
jgi:methylated-DNA-[protein]-cysteine S-methyltransferase